MEIYEGNNWKLYKIFKKLFKCVILPPNRCDLGVDLPIPMTINSSSFGLLSVNEAQDLMPLKFKAFLMNKLHPSKYSSECPSGGVGLQDKLFGPNLAR